MKEANELKLIKLRATENIKQVFFLQLLQYLISDENDSNVEIDVLSIQEKYPAFISTYCFDGIEVNDLFSFIQWNSRPGRETLPLYLGISEYIYCFVDDCFSQECSNWSWFQFPKFFSEAKKSDNNNLVALFLLESVFLFNSKGQFLNFSVHPNLYDRGWVRVLFVDKNFFVVETYDDNNGTKCKFYSYSGGAIKEYLIESDTVLPLLESKGIQWELENLSEELKADRNIAEAAVRASCLNYSQLPVRLKNDPEIASIAFQQCPPLVSDITLDLLSDNDFWFSFLRDTLKNYLSLEEITDDMTLEDCLSVKTLVLPLIGACPAAIPLVSSDLRQDEEVILRALEACISSVWCFPILEENEDLAVNVTIAYPEVLSQLSKYSRDKKFAEKVLRQNGNALRYFDQCIKIDKNLVLCDLNEKDDLPF